MGTGFTDDVITVVSGIVVMVIFDGSVVVMSSSKINMKQLSNRKVLRSVLA